MDNRYPLTFSTVEVIGQAVSAPPPPDTRSSPPEKGTTYSPERSNTVDVLRPGTSPGSHESVIRTRYGFGGLNRKTRGDFQRSSKESLVGTTIGGLQEGVG